MKLYIITAQDNTTEAWSYAETLASLAIMLENGRYEVRAIEEVPDTSAKLPMPAFHQVSHTWPKQG